MPTLRRRPRSPACSRSKRGRRPSGGADTAQRVGAATRIRALIKSPIAAMPLAARGRRAHRHGTGAARLSTKPYRSRRGRGQPMRRSITNPQKENPATFKRQRKGRPFMKKHAIVLMAALVASPAAVWAARLDFDASAHFLINGKRAFMLGVYDTGLGYTNDEASWEQSLFAPGGDVHETRALGSIPLNMYLNYQFGAATISSMQALMNVLQRHGMMYFQTGNCFSHFSWTGGGFGIADQAYVQQFATNPGAAGYYIMDECEDFLLSETTQHHQQLHGWDPGGKTLAVLIADNREPSGWVNSADILGTDPYPLFGAEATTGYPHFLVADMTSRLRMVTPASKPIVSVLQLFKFTDNSRLPTFAEMRTHAIMSIVE